MLWVGNGFPVRSVFDYNGLGRELSPFLLLDYAAPYEFPPSNEKRGGSKSALSGGGAITVAQAAIPRDRSIDLLGTASASLSVQSGKHIRFMSGPYRFSIPVHGARNAFQLRNRKVLQ